MKTMKFVEKGQLFILVHGEQPPSDPEWDDYVGSLGKHAANITAVRVLVVSHGGGPNMVQRKKIKEVAGPKPLPTAVISSSPIARTIVSIIRLTQPEIAAFNPDQRPLAYQHLGFGDADHEWLNREVDRLDRELRAPA